MLASDRAPHRRTLIDILRTSADRHPQAPALDDGTAVFGYAQLLEAVAGLAGALHAAGVRRGDRVGVRLPSGTRDLYVAILAALWAGAAYVPVDADDPDERADLVFAQAAVTAVVTEGPTVTSRRSAPGTGDDSLPTPEPQVQRDHGDPGGTGGSQRPQHTVEVLHPVGQS